MAIAYDEAKDLHSMLERKHTRRHQELHALRRYWQGDYWADAHDDRAGVASVAQLFRDLKGNQSDFGPELKLVHNILQEVCVKYQTFLSPVPMIKTFIDPPYSNLRRKQSTLKERVLYGTWGVNKMPIRMAEIAWFLPLMGDCFIGIWPDYTMSYPKMVVRSPEIAHPVRGFNGALDAVMFRWEADERTIRREFPNFVYQNQAQKGRYRIRPGKANAGGEQKCEIIEYSDDGYYGLWAGEQKLKSIQHDFGFNLFGQMSFIPVPGEDFNHGAVEQIVSMVEMGNALGSLLFQATLENVFPTMVITNPSKAPEDILRGPGSVIPVNEGGRVDYLTPPVQALPVQVAFLKDNQDKILEASGMPRVNFGQAPTSSVATGKAINELQGAGTGSTVEMVQGTGIGPELVAWNEKALTMYQTVFKDKTVSLFGATRNTLDINPRTFALSFKGTDIIGSPRNEVVFSPHINDHEKLVMGLQGLGANLWSKKYVREQLGLSDNDAMVEEILQEQLEDGVLGAIITELQADPSQQHAEQLAAQGSAVVEALPLPNVAPHPLLSGPPQAPPQGGATFPGGPGGVTAPPLPLPQGSPPPVGAPSGAAPAPAAAPGGGTTLEQAQQALSQVPLKGRAFLVGEIVAKGSTTDAVEIAVTDEADKQALQNAAPFPTVFHMVAGKPNEQYVEIGSGAAGGQAPSPDQLLVA